jgi:hypothetical protein
MGSKKASKKKVSKKKVTKKVIKKFNRAIERVKLAHKLAGRKY